MLGLDRRSHRQWARARVLSDVLLAGAFCLAVLTGPGGGRARAEAATNALWDPQRYIGLDEVEPGMEAYCLTDYGQDGIEKFQLKVLNVVREIEPGQDAILVMGLDERFRHTGPVGGCSGSPVYIDGRLAGALAFGWNFAKDPLYGVTPIREMLAVGASKGSHSSGGSSRGAALQFDFTKPIDLAEIDRQLTAMQPLARRRRGDSTTLPCPLLISGLPAETCRQLAPQLEAMGFDAIPALAGAAQAASDSAPPFVPGGTLTIPLVAGDIKMNVLGTVTEVRGDRIYGFGHSFLGYGPTNLPLAGGQIYTVISTVMRSFKLGAPGEIVGAITVDGATAVVGELGATPKMVPLSIHVEPCGGGARQTYNCRVAYNPLLTPGLVRSAVAGAAIPAGASFPPDHTIEYKGAIDLTDGRSIRFANTSTGLDLAEPISEIGGAFALLMNNPYEGAEVKSLSFHVRVAPKNIASYLWSVNVTDPKVKRGEEIEVEVVIESFLREKRRHRVSLTVPQDVSPGKYNLMLLGVYEYENFLRKTLPYRFIATNHQTLVDALNDTLNVARTKLYCLLLLPPDGIALERAELPSLPGIKSMILRSNNRTIRALPYPHWIEKTVETGTVIGDKETIPITVEE